MGPHEPIGQHDVLWADRAWRLNGHGLSLWHILRDRPTKQGALAAAGFCTPDTQGRAP